MKKHVIIKTIRTGIDMGVSPRLKHKIYLHKYTKLLLRRAVTKRSLRYLQYFFFVNSLQMQAFFQSCGGKPQKWLIWLIWFNTSHEGRVSRRLNFGVQFWKCTKWDGVELSRHRTGLLCKSCQTILWFKKIHVSYVHIQAQERSILMAL